MLLCAPAFVWTAELLAGTPPLVLVAAFAPAILLAALLFSIQRRRGRPIGTLALAFAWGATAAAWASTTGNELARSWLEASATGDDRILTAILVAPLLEEAAKALGLLVIAFASRDGLRDTRDGIVHGALVGIGFVATENLLYLGIAMLQGGEAGLVRALYLRGVLGAATHAVFSACAGAGIGWWIAERSRRFAPLLGFAAAHAQHVTWNAFGAPVIAAAICGTGTVCMEAPGPFVVFGHATAIAGTFLAPGVALLVLAWTRLPRAEESRVV